MLADIRGQLDAIERRKVGGALDLYGFARQADRDGVAGVGIDYGHRITTDLSAFARGRLGTSWGASSGVWWDVLGGLRYSF